jgi:hypothetical protein
MRYFEMPHFQRFSQNHLGSRDYVGYQLQLKWILSTVKEKGRFEKTLKIKDGEACITYYYYDPSERILYVLAGHLKRQGEPRPEEIKAVESYIQQIERGRP